MLRRKRGETVLARLEFVLHFVSVNNVHRLVAIVEVVTTNHVRLIAQVTVTWRLGNYPPLVLYLRHVHLPLRQLVSYCALRARVVLAHQIDLCKVILILLDTLLPILLEHIVIVLEFRVLPLRQGVATRQVGWRVLHSLRQVLLTPIILQHRVALVATQLLHALVTTD